LVGFTIGFHDTVDGSEIRRSPVEVGKSPIIYRVSYIPGGAGFQPSTVSLAIELSSLWKLMM